MSAPAPGRFGVHTIHPHSGAGPVRFTAPWSGTDPLLKPPVKSPKEIVLNVRALPAVATLALAAAVVPPFVPGGGGPAGRGGR